MYILPWHWDENQWTRPLDQTRSHYSFKWGSVLQLGLPSFGRKKVWDQIRRPRGVNVWVYIRRVHCKNHILIHILLSTWWNVQTKYLLAWTQKFCNKANFCVTVSSCQLFEQCKQIYLFSGKWCFLSAAWQSSNDIKEFSTIYINFVRDISSLPNINSLLTKTYVVFYEKSYMRKVCCNPKSNNWNHRN